MQVPRHFLTIRTFQAKALALLSSYFIRQFDFGLAFAPFASSGIAHRGPLQFATLTQSSACLAGAAAPDLGKSRRSADYSFKGGIFGFPAQDRGSLPIDRVLFRRHQGIALSLTTLSRAFSSHTEVR
jgi:hypothetical protein